MDVLMRSKIDVSKKIWNVSNAQMQISNWASVVTYKMSGFQTLGIFHSFAAVKKLRQQCQLQKADKCPWVPKMNIAQQTRHVETTMF